jgi:hypothetical protein
MELKLRFTCFRVQSDFGFKRPWIYSEITSVICPHMFADTSHSRSIFIGLKIEIEFFMISMSKGLWIIKMYKSWT